MTSTFEPISFVHDSPNPELCEQARNLLFVEFDPVGSATVDRSADDLSHFRLLFDARLREQEQKRDMTSLALHQPAGIIAVGMLRPEEQDSMWLFRVAVEAGLRGQGYGKQMMQLLEAHAVELGARTMRLFPLERVDNKGRPLRTFYENLGYAMVGNGCMRKTLTRSS